MHSSSVFSNLNAKICFVFGLVALVVAVAMSFAPEMNDGRPGLIAYVVNNFIGAFQWERESMPFPTMYAVVGILSESEEKLVLNVVCVFFAILAGVMGTISAYRKESGLVLATGIAAAFCAMLFVHASLAIGLAVMVAVGKDYLTKRPIEVKTEGDSVLTN